MAEPVIGLDQTGWPQLDAGRKARTARRCAPTSARSTLPRRTRRDRELPLNDRDAQWKLFTGYWQTEPMRRPLPDTGQSQSGTDGESPSPAKGTPTLHRELPP